MLQGCVPWPDEFVEKYVAEGYWGNITLGEAFDRVAESFPNKEALVFNDERITYRQLKTISDQLAAGFLKSGLKPLDRVIVQLPNISEFVSCYFAFLRIGVTPVMCLPQHRLTEIKYIANQCEAKGYLIPDKISKFNFLELAEEVCREVPSLEKVFVAGQDCPDGYISIKSLLEDNIEEKQISEMLKKNKPSPYEVAVFLLSGGTTGLPKIIPRTHNDYLYTAKITGMHMGVSKYTTYLAIAPLAHNMTLACPGITGVFQRGGKVVLTASTAPDNLCKVIEKEKVTNMGLVPALIISLLNHERRKDYDLSSLVAIVSGGSKLNPEVAKGVKPELGCNLIQQFGMAEGLLTMTDDTSDSDRVTYETIGHPLSPADEVRIVNDDGMEVPVGDIGELLCRGPYTIRGYYKATEHNKKAFTEDGFYKSGDMVRIDPESGYLTIEGRVKDVINRGGEKISAEEIENLILAHPKVKNAAAVAMPDSLLGERCCAYVILKENESLDLTELNVFLSDRKIAKFKLPERLEVVNNFPMTNVGKISKKDLRKDIENKLVN
ncbi:MAG: AMP-binding protein [Bacillota bacterium]|nr:AMP-binding protein [Bacillota bacterium]